jgi:hypothetical protein
VLSEVQLVSPFKEEDEPATAPVLQHVRLIATLTIERYPIAIQEQLA